MSENDNSNRLNENERRKPLGDVTNQLKKRDFSLISSSSSSSNPSKYGNKSKLPPSESALEIDKGKDPHFWKQVALVIEKFEKARGSSSSVKCPSVKCPKKVPDEPGLSPLKGGKIYRLQSPSEGGCGSSMSKTTQIGVPSSCLVKNVVEGPPVSALDCIDLSEAEPNVEVIPNAVALDDGVPKERCIPSVTVGESSKDCQREATVAVANEAEIDRSQEALAAQVGSSRLLETGTFSLERCSEVKSGSCADMSSDLDSLKSCSCSFCSKAAYIWSDLHYQDVKGRISILMKSQREASNLAKRYLVGNEMDRHGQGKSSKVTDTEIDLTNQWKSLFLHMESIYGSESSLLQADLLALKSIREDFKTNLETIIGGPSDVQPCSSSDASDNLDCLAPAAKDHS